MPEQMNFTPGKYHALFDYPMTRRKRFHILIGPTGDLAFTAPTVEAILDHLVEQGENSILAEGDFSDFVITFKRGQEHSEPRLRGPKRREV